MNMPAPSNPNPANDRPTETDPRFPSGPWTGFWIQQPFGKQTMSLSLAFSEGRVTGTGRDIIGLFDFAGQYDLKTGKVQMIKQYHGAHRVLYDGANQGDGLWLWGIWTLRIYRGGFHLWPEGEDDPTQRRLRTQRELPGPKRKVKLKDGELLPV
jgi:hypothetical protein